MRGLFISAVVLSLLACTGGATTAPPPPPPATPTTPTAPAEPVAPPAAPASNLPAPWSTMNLPVGNGEVVEADTDKLLIAYDNASLTGLTDSWIAALNALGYTQREDVSSPGLTAIVYGKGAQLFGLATGTEEGVNFVYMEDLGRVQNSAIRGKRKPGGMKGRHRRPGGPGGPGGR